MIDESKCRAEVWPKDGYWHPYQCSNGAKVEREGFPLCKTHAKAYDRGSPVTVITGVFDPKERLGVTWTRPGFETTYIRKERSSDGLTQGAQ